MMLLSTESLARSRSGAEGGEAVELSEDARSVMFDDMVLGLELNSMCVMLHVSRSSVREKMLLREWQIIRKCEFVGNAGLKHFVLCDLPAVVEEHCQKTEGPHYCKRRLFMAFVCTRFLSIG